MKLFNCKEKSDDIGDRLQAHYLYLDFRAKLNKAALQFREECMTERGDKP